MKRTAQRRFPCRVLMCACVGMAVALTSGVLVAAPSTGQPTTADEQRAASERRDSNEAGADNKDKSQATPANGPTTKKKIDRRDAEIFHPSEEISEDFAVSFPVDI